MLKQPLEQLPVNLHLCVNETMGYFSFNNTEDQTTYLIFNETGLLSVFLDYLESLQDSSFYTSEETCNFIKYEIDNLQYQQLCSKRKSIAAPHQKGVSV